MNDFIKKLLEGTYLTDEDPANLPPIPYRNDYAPGEQLPEEIPVPQPQLETAPAPQAPQPQVEPQAQAEEPMQEDTGLQDAYSERDDLRKKADLLRGFKSIGQALATGTGYKADMTMANELSKRAEDPVNKYKWDLKEKQLKQSMKTADMKAKEMGIKLDQMGDLNDPGHKLASVLRADLQSRENKLAKSQGREPIQIGEDMSFWHLNHLDDHYDKGGDLTTYQKLSLEKRGKELEYKKTGEDRRQNTLELNTARNYLKDDPRFKKAVEQGTIYKEVDMLLNEVSTNKNQAALAALGTKLARAMGEVGVLTDADVVRYLGTKSWGRKINEWYSGGMEGTLPEESIRELKKNTKYFRKHVNNEVNEIYDNAEDRLVSAMGLSKKRARDLVGNRPFSDSKESEYSAGQEKGIELVMKNNKVSREKAISALKKANKL
jgi:hypothetical protein